MSKIREYETLVATASEYEALGMHDRARETRAAAEKMKPDYDAERVRIRAAAGGPLAALGDAVTAAGPPKPAQWHEEMTPERKARRATLSPLLGAADAIEEKNRRGRGQ